MTYTINGKEWTKSNINERCAVLMGIEYELNDIYVMIPDEVASIETGVDEFMEYCPCYSPSDTDAIIDKCWDELLKNVGFDGDDDPYYDNTFGIRWQYIIEEHNCTKLVAACICYIEINEAAL
jgi:predicted 3-demethylubiquinone-9 3-methyltransferase (glyoxalase superfamily)